ncbi:unnamed protein product [Microthlaspi erraticum]|uniref:F-box associated domain-containing protein n=1 Tax=Microthlaspi erraticum TaxID=1685480 RepID=A0A6D2HH11_9BRAS|nr:unnamed protein product [Microthlaspi erraticum]
MFDTTANIVDGRIYVIRLINSKNTRMVVFNTQTQTWKPKMIKSDFELRGMWRCECVVVADKLYTRDCLRAKGKAYDLKKCWGVVNGVEELVAEIRLGECGWETAVSY